MKHMTWMALCIFTALAVLPLAPGKTGDGSNAGRDGFAALIAPAAAQSREDPAYRSAVILLRECLSVSRRGSHKSLTEALRHLKDPKLKPLFEELTRQRHPQLQIQGMLGLAELRDPPKVDLAALAELDDEAVQVAVITNAIDADLIGIDDLKKIIAWKDLPDEVKLIVASYLLKERQFDDADMLAGYLDHDLLLQRGLAAVMLTQLGDPRGGETLAEFTADAGLQRQEATARLLELVFRHGFDRLGPWAANIARDERAVLKLQMLALKVALRYNAPGAVAIWRERFGSATDMAQRVLLGMSAMEVALWAQPTLYDPLIAREEPLLRQMGLAGKAIAADADDLADEVVRLIEMNNPIVNRWAYVFADEYAETTNAQIILFAMVMAYTEGPERGRNFRLDQAISATQSLFEKDPAVATNLLRPMLADPDTNKQLIQGILLGLVRATSPGAHRVVRGLPPFEDVNIQGLVLLLRARHAQEKLTEKELDKLALLARGGGGFYSSLRIQVAWLYLKRRGLAQQALAESINF